MAAGFLIAGAILLHASITTDGDGRPEPPALIGVLFVAFAMIVWFHG